MNKHELTLVQAITYARMGWPVFPCKHFGDRVKSPATLHGFKDATTDETQIIEWWTNNPKALIGVATGKKAGFWVVDVDMKKGHNGEKSLRDNYGNELFTEATLIQKTPTGGKHILFKWNDDRPVGCGTDLLDGIDIRGEGGYIIVAPSGYYINDKWAVYEWNTDDFIISEAPEWAYQLTQLNTLSGSEKSSLDLTAVMSGIPEGQRDEQIYKYVCHLAAREVPIDIAIGFVKQAGLLCRPPFNPVDLEEKLIRAYGAKKEVNMTSFVALKTKKKDLLELKKKRK